MTRARQVGSVLFLFLSIALAACGASQRPDPRATDGDGDLVADADDACPSDAEDRDGRHDEDGCPDLDDDADTIADVSDVCPCDMEDRDGHDDEDGCPDPDNDGDRIVDACDLCPNDPETYNGGCDEDGCPDYGHICVSDSRIVILEYVFFTRGSAQIPPQALPIVDAVAEAMAGNPQITLVAIVGQIQAGERGGQSLARRRAQAVVDALIERHVDRARLAAEAGPSEAVAGLEPDQQRRVGFAVRTIDGEAVGAESLPSSDGCGRSYTECEVPVCEPVVTPPAC